MNAGEYATNVVIATLIAESAFTITNTSILELSLNLSLVIVVVRYSNLQSFEYLKFEPYASHGNKLTVTWREVNKMR